MNKKMNPEQRIKLLGCLSYMGPLCFVPLMNRDSEFVHFHAKQGLILWAISHLLFVFMVIPFLGGFIIKLFTIALFIWSGIGIINVLLNKSRELPIIGSLAHLI